MNRYAKLLSMLYTDRMDIYPVITQTGADGATRSARGEAKAQSVPCRISYRGGALSFSHDRPSPGEGENPIEQQLLVFCAPDQPVSSGDYIVATRLGIPGRLESSACYEGYAGEPNLYMGSAQFLLYSRKQG